MSKLVYLFDLDSANKETDTSAFDSLFHEIVDNGNCVAISMNQLTDSAFFARTIEDDYVYPLVMRLFETGAIKVSLYGDIRSASQYVQSVIERCLSETGDCFVFSNLPVNSTETKQLEIIRDALKFSDAGRINELVNHSQDIKPDDLESIRRFVSMVLKLSTISDGSIPAKNPAGRSFEFFLDAAMRLLTTAAFSDKDLDREIKKALSSLERESQFIATGRNNRSNWLSVCGAKTEIHPMATEIINLCYNYTIEDSIDGVCKHYDDSNFDETFLSDMKRRLLKMQENRYKKKGKAERKQRWKMLVRFAEYGKNQPVEQGGVYENEVPEQNRSWKKLSIIRATGSLGWAVFYAVLFFAVEWLMGWIEDTFALSLPNAFISTMLNIFVFSLVGFVTGVILKRINKDHEVPDIFECINDMFWRIVDCIHVLF